MAMNAQILAAAIVLAWKAKPGIGFSSPMSAAQEAMVLALAQGVAEAVVAHFQSFAAVTSTGADPQGGVVASMGTVA